MGKKLDQTGASSPNKEVSRRDGSDSSNGSDATNGTDVSTSSGATNGSGAPNASALTNLVNLERLRRTERLVAARKVASFLAHEIGTPLNVVGSRASMIAAGEHSGQEALDSARKIAEQAARIAKNTREFLELVRARPPRTERVDLLAVANAAHALAPLTNARFASSSERGSEVALKLDPQSETAPVIGDVDELLFVALGLLRNRVQASPAGGTVTLAARCTRRPPAYDPNGPPMELATLSVRDAGPGLPKDSIPLLWKPFYSAKMTDGEGLDLPMVDYIVREHGGSIEVESDVGSGNCFTVYLPRGDG